MEEGEPLLAAELFNLVSIACILIYLFGSINICFAVLNLLYNLEIVIYFGLTLHTVSQVKGWVVVLKDLMANTQAANQASMDQVGCLRVTIRSLFPLSPVRMSF